MADNRPAEPMQKTLFLSDENITALRDWKDAIDALRRAYAEPLDNGMVPPRSMARGDGVWLRGLSAIAPGGRYMGCKLISASLRHRYASYLVALYDQNSARLLSLMDGNQITGIRTAATAAVAADVLATQTPLHVAVIGSGFEARAQLAALLAIRTPQTVSVCSPTRLKREQFVADFQDRLGDAIFASDDPAAVVGGANLVICATRSRDESPVLYGAWLQPGTTVISIGSTLPEQREVDPEVLRKAACIVADMVDEVVAETGDGIAAAAAGIDVRAKTRSLAEVVSGGSDGRRGPSDIVVYKSVGSALQDVVTAAMLYERAIQTALGTAMPVSIVPVKK